MVDDVYYISGPMTGHPKFNIPAFDAKAMELRGRGLRVVSPAELAGEGEGHSWEWYIRRDLKALVDCTAVVLLPGWEDSRGARLEVHVARALGMTVYRPGEL